MRICPKCKTEYGDDVKFCDSCCERLVKVDAETRADAASGSVDSEDAFPPQPEIRTNDCGGHDTSGMAREVQHAEPQETGGNATDGDVLVEYAINRMLLAGGQVTLSLYISGTHEPVLAAHVWQKMELNGTLARKDAECEVRDNGRVCAFTCAIDNAAIFGSTTAVYHIAVLFPSRIAFYVMQAEHEIWAKDTTPQQIQTNINVSGKSLLEHVVLPSCTSGQDLANKLNGQAPYYVPMKVWPTDWRPEDEICVGGDYDRPSETDKLTLVVNGFALYVSAQQEIRMGRHPYKNDFAILDWKQNRRADEYPTGSVSRQQLMLSYLKNSVLLYTEKESTQVNGVSPGIAGNRGMPLKDKCILGMGGIAFDMEIQHCGKRTRSQLCYNCPADNVKAVTLKRRDRLPEAFVMVWECCDLSQLHDGLAGFVLYRRNGGFLLREPSGAVLNLATYMTATIGQVKLSVYPFIQRIIGSEMPF